MRLLERYLFSQLLIAVVWTAAALTGVALLTSSLSTLDILVNQHQSALVFLEATLLATPQIVALILPMAMFIAAMMALNRLHTEQEIVICFAGGMSPWRVASPTIQVASLVAVVILALNLWVQPLCFRELRAILEAVRGDLAATMITPGQFTHPTGGLTVYAQSTDKQGVIHNLFIDAAGPKGQSSTVMASEARFAKRDGAPVLILHGGAYEQLTKTGDLNVLQFDEYPIDLRPFLAVHGQIRYRESDRYLHELFFPDPRDPWSQVDRKAMLAEGNERLASPLYSLAFTALSLAAVLGGAFSRLGYGARIAAATTAGLVVRVVGFIVGAASASDPRLNALQYAAPVLCFAISMVVVLRQHPTRGASRLADAPPLAAGKRRMRLALGRLDRYMLTCGLAGLGGALGTITAVVMLISFVDLSHTYGGRADVSFLQLFTLVLLQTPSIVLLLLPFVFLFGGLSTFVALNRRSELIAMRAAGVSAWRFILPAAGMAAVIGVLDVAVLNPLAAGLDGRFEDAKDIINQGGGHYGASPVWLRQGDEHDQVVIHALSHDMKDGLVRLQQVSLFMQKMTPSGALQFTRRIDAAEARLYPGYWRLTDVREAAPGAVAVRADSISIPSTLDRRTAMEKFAAKDAVGFWRLPETIRRADAAGFSSAPYRLRFFELLATPLLFAGMSILAAAFSLRLIRLGGVAGLAAAGVALGFVIFFFDRLCGALAAAEIIPPFVGAWAPPLVAMLAGFTLLCYTEDG